MERLAFNVGAARRDVTSPYAFPTDQGAAPTAPPQVTETSSKRKHIAERRDWAFTWTLIFTAILFLRPQDIFLPLGALHLAELSAIAGLVSMFAGRLGRRQRLSTITPEFVGVLALGGIILLTAPFSIWFGGAVGTFTDQYLKVALVYLLAVNVLISPQRIERLTWTLVLSVGYVGARAVWDYRHGVNLIAGGTRVQGSVGGLLGNPNDLALHMVVLIPFALFIAMRPGTTLKRLVAAGAGMAMTAAVVASGSRGGFLGFVAMVLVTAFFAARKRPGIVFAGALALFLALPLLPSNYWHRLASITDSSKDESNSSEARKRLFGESWDAFLDNPIVGVGAGQFKNYKPEARVEAWHETHNVWLQVAAETGIFGFAVFAYLMYRAIQGVWKPRHLLARIRAAAAAARRPSAMRRKPLPAPVISEQDALLLDGHSAAMGAALAGFLVCSFFASVAYNWTFYYLLALAVAPQRR